MEITLSGSRPKSRAIELALGAQFGVGAQFLEGGGGVPRRIARHGERTQIVGVLGGAVLEVDVSRRVEKHVEDRPLRGREQDLLYELLALHAAGVAPDKLHAGAGKREVEEPGVRRVHQVQAHDLSCGRLTRETALAVYEHDVAEAAHRHEVRPRVAEGRHLAVLDQDVVQGDGQLPVCGWPVGGV